MSERIDEPKSASAVLAEWRDELSAMDAHAAAWAVASQWHGGQGAPLYAVLSVSEFKPGPLMSAERIAHDTDGEWLGAYVIYHEALTHRTEAERAAFLVDMMRLLDGVR